jgi:hypothetical protein
MFNFSQKSFDTHELWLRLFLASLCAHADILK